MNYTKLDGIPIRLSIDDKETRNILASGKGNVLITELDPDIEVSQLDDAFSNFGELISCEIPLKNGKSQEFGYVIFKNEADAKCCIRDLADASLNGRPIKLELFNPFNFPPL